MAHPGSQPAPEGHVRPDDDARGKQCAPLQLELGIQVWAHHVLDVLWEFNEQGVCLSGSALSAPPGPVAGGLVCCAIMLQNLLSSIIKPLSRSCCQKPVSKAIVKSHCQQPVGCSLKVLCT